MKKILLPIAYCALGIYSYTVISAPATTDKELTYDNNKLLLNASIGYLQGQSQEFVYYADGRKMSELIWDIKQASIMRGGISYDFLSSYTVAANGWVTISKGQAMMNDYDWLYPFQSSPSDWSYHENTQLEYANDFDLNVRKWLVQKDSYKLGIMAGYERSTFSFLATGGCYQYDNAAFIGCFPANELGIGYQQEFETVYVGLAGQYIINKFEFGAGLKYGPWVNSSDVDQHYMRNLTFIEHGDNANFYSAALNSAYEVNNETKLFIEAVYNHFTNTKADTEIIDHIAGRTLYIPNSAGLNNKNYFLSLGLQYRPNFSK